MRVCSSCFPTSSGTDHCDTVSKHSLPSHFTKDIPSNISQVRTRSTKLQNLHHCLENREGYHLRNGEMVMMRRNAYFADNLGMNDKCQEHVFFTSVSQYLDIFKL